MPPRIPQAGQEARAIADLLRRDDDHVSVFGRRYLVVETPPGHEPGNILGLRAIMDLGLCVDEDGTGFRFRCPDVVQP